MAIKAKVALMNKTTTSYDNSNGFVQLSFQAVSGPENEEWAMYTPSLSLTMTVKTEVGEKFPFGEYFLTFEEV